AAAVRGDARSRTARAGATARVVAFPARRVGARDAAERAAPARSRDARGRPGVLAWTRPRRTAVPPGLAPADAPTRRLHVAGDRVGRGAGLQDRRAATGIDRAAWAASPPRHGHARR